MKHLWEYYGVISDSQIEGSSYVGNSDKEKFLFFSYASFSAQFQ